MNTPEKYICAYIVESLTGIQGSSHDKVVEVLRNSNFSIDDPFLNLVYGIAKENPESKDIKDVVAGLVMGQTLLTNKPIQKAIEATIEDMAKRTPKKERKAIVTLCYTREEDGYLFTVWFDLKPMAKISVPKDMKETVIEKFEKKFPEGYVIGEN